jgi:hypothetical protein
MIKKSIVVGFDFDGVVAYNPARLARLPISMIKHALFGKSKVSFFVPKTPLQKTLWALAHETSVFPAKGASLLRELTHKKIIEAHLVTGRFGYLEPGLRRFLDRWNLSGVFTSITLNTKEEQPHVYKERVLRVKQFDYFVEDNWDIVEHLSHTNLKTSVYWVYNILDIERSYDKKVPYMEKALKAIIQ